MDKTKLITNNIAGLSKLLSNLSQLTPDIEKTCEIMSSSLAEGGIIFICGNGGSAADAQHAATELVVRYKHNRKGIPAIALTTDTSILTAAGNDLGFENVFARQVEALMKPTDLLIAISTSGKSRNVIRAVEEAKAKGAKTIAFTGTPGQPLTDIADFTLKIPSSNTPRIQEAQILVWHILCDLLEQELL